MVEKHFPAPDRRKFFDIFGLGNNSNYDEDSNLSTPGSNKRKKGKLYHTLNTPMLYTTIFTAVKKFTAIKIKIFDKNCYILIG